MEIQRPRGTRDLHGSDLRKTGEISRIIREIFRAYGYSEISTPIFEDSRVFEDNDGAQLGANKEFFRIQRRGEGGTDYVLRPENTASVARAAIENRLITKQTTGPVALFYEGPYFRYERPQFGRFRQFTQMGIEKLNASSPIHDLENIFLVQEILDRLSLKLTLKINYLGSLETKKKWCEALDNYFRQHEDRLSELSRSRIGKNPFRILDDALESEEDLIKGAPKLEYLFALRDFENLGFFKSALANSGVDHLWEPTLVRGIDYYTGLVYEWVHEKSGTTVIAGGRYDGLLDRFGLSNIPSLGLAIGVDRLKLILEEEEKYEWKTGRKILYLHSNGEKFHTNFLLWTRRLRSLILDQGEEIHCLVSHFVYEGEQQRKLAPQYLEKEDVLVAWPWKGALDPKEDLTQILEEFSRKNQQKNH